MRDYRVDYPVERRVTGGLRLEAHKAESTSAPVRRGFMPPQLVVAMRQHRGAHAEPIVRPGERVWKWQTIGRASGPQAAAVHAATSGRVRAVEERMVPGARKLRRSVCVIIDVDGQDAPVDRLPVWPEGREERLRAIRDAGIVGLGGAAYPTADKVGAVSQARALIINGAECEPYISCDDMLMRERADEVLRGTAAMVDLLDAPLAIIAIEQDKPQALKAIREAAAVLGDERVRVAEIPAVYPAGGERQLIELLLGQEIPSGSFPAQLGVPCQNVGTARAIARLVEHGEPLVSRVVTVTGRGVAEPCNVDVPIGACIRDLIEYCGGYTGEIAKLVLGGSMMGYPLPGDDLPVTKACNCLIAALAEEVRPGSAERACIRCGECSRVCPARLMPQELLVAAKTEDYPALAELALNDCIECGCCDVVCPSEIPLTQYFRDAKDGLAAHNEELELSAASQIRFEQRERRRAQREHESRVRRDELIGPVRSDPESRHEAIQAAIRRARKRREAESHRD